MQAEDDSATDLNLPRDDIAGLVTGHGIFKIMADGPRPSSSTEHSRGGKLRKDVHAHASWKPTVIRAQFRNGSGCIRLCPTRVYPSSIIRGTRVLSQPNRQLPSVQQVGMLYVEKHRESTHHFAVHPWWGDVPNSCVRLCRCGRHSRV